MQSTELTPILQRLDTIAAQVAYVAERQRKQEELLAEMTPIARVALGEAIARLDTLDRKGYFAFVRELAGVGQRVVEGFSPQDVRQLGDAVVGILETIRDLTQPAVLQVAADASAAIQRPEDIEPVGVFGAVRATRDDDVQRGLGLVIEVLRRIGQGADAVAKRQVDTTDRKEKLAKLLGSRRKVERPQLPAAAAAPACAAPPKPVSAARVVDGIAYTAEGHLVDAGAWSRDLAQGLAAAQGVTMTDAHWAIVDAARGDFAGTQVSPNIRRLTQVSGIATKDLYALFPKAPARTIAKIAGLPKPAGCL